MNKERGTLVFRVVFAVQLTYIYIIGEIFDFSIILIS